MRSDPAPSSNHPEKVPLRSWKIVFQSDRARASSIVQRRLQIPELNWNTGERQNRSKALLPRTALGRLR